MRGNPNHPYYNAEGYADPTPYYACRDSAEDEKYKTIAKKWLYRYLNLETELKTLSDEINALKAQRDSMAIKLDGMPRGSGKADPTANMATDLADREKRLAEMRADAIRKRAEIVDYVLSIGNPVQSRILYLHFVQGKTFEYISGADINMSFRQTLRIYRDALIKVGRDLERCH